MTPSVRRPRWEPLEPRVLYSADPAPVALAGQVLVAAAQPVTEVAPTQAAPGPELVVIDARVTGRNALVEDLRAQQAAGRPVTLLLLEDGDDAIVRIGAALSASDTPVAAIHLIGHGEPGSMILGSGSLDLDAVRTRAGELAAWSSRLAPGADLLLYGCDVAADADGERVLDALAALTGADVAASIDPTGAVTAGGDWILERRTGTIEAALAPSAAAQAAWQGLLANNDPVVSTPSEVPAGGTSSFLASTPQMQNDQGYGRQLATAADGRRALVWVQDGDIKVGIWDAADRPLADYTFDHEWSSTRVGPAVAFDGQGNLLVTWVTVQDGTITGLPRAWIEGVVLTADGSYGGSLELSDIPTGLPESVSIEEVSLERPDIAGRTGEGFRLVTDVQSTDDLLRGGIFTADVGVDGSVSRFSLVQGDWSASSTLRVTRPTITTLTDDGFAIGWASAEYALDRTTRLTSTVHVSIRTATGDPISGDTPARWTVNDTQEGFFSPDVAGDPDGGVWVVWGDQEGDRILALHLDATGTPLQSEPLTIANRNGAWYVGTPAVAVAADGSLWMAWLTVENDYTESIVLRNFDRDGNAISTPVTVGTNTLQQDAPSIALDGSALRIAWSNQIAAGKYWQHGDWVYPNWTVMAASATLPDGPQSRLTPAVSPASASLVPPPSLDVPTPTIYEGVQGAQFTVVGLPDPDKSADWSVTGPDAGAFSWKTGWDADGHATLTLTLTRTPDFEALVAQGLTGYQVDVAMTRADGQSAAATLAVTVRDVNEPFTLSASARVETDEDRPVALGPGAVVVSDPDAGQALTLTLTVDGGMLALGRLDGLSSVQGDGSGKVVMTGGVDALNGALAALIWRPAPDWNGTLSLKIDAVDPGDATIPARSVTLSLKAKPANDPPVVVRNAGITAFTGTLTTIDAQVLSATDIDQRDPTKLVYRIDALPDVAELRWYPNPDKPKNFKVLVKGDTFLQSDLDAGRIVYVARDATAAGASIALTLSDGQGGDVAVSLSLEITPAPVSQMPMGISESPSVAADTAPSAAQPPTPSQSASQSSASQSSASQSSASQSSASQSSASTSASLSTSSATSTSLSTSSATSTSLSTSSATSTSLSTSSAASTSLSTSSAESTSLSASTFTATSTTTSATTSTTTFSPTSASPSATSAASTRPGGAGGANAAGSAAAPASAMASSQTVAAPAGGGSTQGGSAKSTDTKADAGPAVVGDAGPGGIRTAVEARAGGRGSETAARASDSVLPNGSGNARDGDRRGVMASDDPLRRATGGRAGDRDGWRGIGAGNRDWTGVGDGTLHPIAQTLRALPASEGLARVREEAREQVALDRSVVATSAAVTTGLSIGYAIWLLRGGVLLSSLLASVPAWRSFDPMVILAKPTAGSGADGEDDSLQSMLSRAAERYRGARARADAGHEESQS